MEHDLLCESWGERGRSRAGKGSLGQDVRAAGERFPVKELICDEAMDGFHIGLVAMR